jgi:hypothetical protein
MLGFPIAIVAILPPAVLPPGAGSNNPRCKQDPKPQCSDCGGDNGVGLCNGPLLAGCPCGNNGECPDNPPQCSDPRCGGDDGLSHCSGSSTWKGCTCCPDTPPDCGDSRCLGGSGLSCTGETYKKCLCDLVISDIEAEFEVTWVPDWGTCYYSVIASSVVSNFYGNNPSNLPGWHPTTTAA